jgi:hypothetical protein
MATPLRWRVGADVEVWSTRYQGRVKTTYDKLVAAFGPPTFGPNSVHLSEATCEWRIMFEDTIVATVYDSMSTPETPRNMTDWQVGGYDHLALECVRDALRAEFVK